LTLNPSDLQISSYSDDELLYAIRHDDEKAFAELFERYWKQVHAMTYAMVLSMDATQEIVKKIFISVWDNRATLSITHLPSYLKIETKNGVLNYIDSQRKIRRGSRYHKHFTAHHGHANDHDVNIDELIESLECGTNGLLEKSKKIFRFHRLEKLSIAEIARSLISLKRLFNIISHH
jgi:DNA-directed RNA polymerase specialized sigma24 family protein